MNFDFALILTALTLISGVIWAIDRLLFKRRREQLGDSGEPKLVEYARSFFPIFLVVLLFRSFLFEPFKIPSRSMLPTLLVGDFILVNKFDYGLRLPVLNRKIVDIGEPERGDVVVFRYPLDNSTNYIKRLIGLPGDTITYRNKRLYINGDAVPTTADGSYTLSDNKCDRPAPGLQRFSENLGGVEHDMLISGGGMGSGARSWTVPEGHYFLMGDNRDNSRDSRVWGFVPEENLVGKAVRIWLNMDVSQGCMDWSRIGDPIN